jgi:hypothetical protein
MAGILPINLARAVPQEEKKHPHPMLIIYHILLYQQVIAKRHLSREYVPFTQLFVFDIPDICIRCLDGNVLRIASRTRI